MLLIGVATACDVNVCYYLKQLNFGVSFGESGDERRGSICAVYRSVNDNLALPRVYAVQQSKKNSLDCLTIEDGNHKLCRYVGNHQLTLHNVSVRRRPIGKVRYCLGN
jgi:hypothetical protein